MHGNLKTNEPLWVTSLGSLWACFVSATSRECWHPHNHFKNLNNIRKKERKHTHTHTHTPTPPLHVFTGKWGLSVCNHPTENTALYDRGCHPISSIKDMLWISFLHHFRHLTHPPWTEDRLRFPAGPSLLEISSVSSFNGDYPSTHIPLLPIHFAQSWN